MLSCASVSPFCLLLLHSLGSPVRGHVIFPPPFPSLQTFQQPAMWLTCKHFVEVAIVK